MNRIPAERKWIWIGVGFMMGSFLLMTWLAVISLAYQQPEVPVAQVGVGGLRVGQLKN